MKRKQTRRSNTATRPRRFSRVGVSLIIVMGLISAVAGALNTSAPSSNQSVANVLAYATGLSHGGLLGGTNQARSASGLAGLSINSKLNSAAQAKANDMVTKDYWAHTSPDGRQPWDFIAAAGYSYQTAGENLAYGALTSQQTVDAWMNSPGHRANILNTTFTEVGFGFTNAPNFVGDGEQTVVVAMYASPYAAPAPAPTPTPTPAPTPAPAPSNPTPTSSPSTPTQSSPAAQPAASPVESTSSEPVSDESTAESSDTISQDDQQQAPSTENIQNDGTVPTQPGQVRRIQVLTGIYTPWIVAVVAISGVAAGGTFLYRHSRRWHRWIVHGEQFVIHHVALDILVLVLGLIAIILLRTVGHII